MKPTRGVLIALSAFFGLGFILSIWGFVAELRSDRVVQPYDVTAPAAFSGTPRGLVLVPPGQESVLRVSDAEFLALHRTVRDDGRDLGNLAPDERALRVRIGDDEAQRTISSLALARSALGPGYVPVRVRTEITDVSEDTAEASAVVDYRDADSGSSLSIEFALSYWREGSGPWKLSGAEAIA